MVPLHHYQMDHITSIAISFFILITPFVSDSDSVFSLFTVEKLPVNSPSCTNSKTAFRNEKNTPSHLKSAKSIISTSQHPLLRVWLYLDGAV